VKRKAYPPQKIIAVLFAVPLMIALIAGCSADLEDPDSRGTTTSGTTGDNSTAQNEANYTLSLPNQTVNLTEGENVSATIRIQRNNGYKGQVTIGADNDTTVDSAPITWAFANEKISENENSTTINLKLDYSALPIQPGSRTVRIVATDGNLQRSALLTVNIQPTTLADVYLLIGQSNMVGFSEENAKQAGVAGDDEPVDRIKQLNVTGNDQQNFSSAASFKNVDAIAAPSPRLTPAVDPLHHGFDIGRGGKGGTQVGLGLSFAKRAEKNTQANTVYLVPAAWADTGFCRRKRNNDLKLFEGDLGWNATDPLNAELSGTLLHDRAIARTNLTLRETNGILRGILWHQGEADSENMACAQIYEQNLAKLVKSLRTEIIADARGTGARGEGANVPFVVGTMSKAPPYNELSAAKALVDEAHRNIKEYVKFSAFVNNDDLVPPTYQCGDKCIHFGAKAYRHMGSDYYDQLLEAAIGQ